MTTPLNTRFNVAVNHIASRLFPCGFDVADSAPGTLDSLLKHYLATGRVMVWGGASEQTIFADSETNFAFRAWHDSKHIFATLPFTLAGETQAFAMQATDITALYDGQTARDFIAILRAEIIGQFEYKESLGGFPIDQIGFVRLYLSDPLAALNVNFGISKSAGE